MFDLNSLPDNLEVFDSFIKAASKLEGYKAEDIMVSISGGADSDIMLDLITRIKPGVHFVFFDTGLEYQAAKEHLTFLEAKYGIKIERKDAKMPIPTSCRKYGQPFLSKQVSENIERLQRHGFQWEDEPFDVLYAKYPKCKVALRWWCNQWGDNSRFNISYNKLLKEFMIAHPPALKISNRCCAGAKKNVAKEYKRENGIRLSLVGVRKAEGGARSSIPNCFTPNAGNSGVDEYRPLFWYLNDSKKAYEEHFNVTHSRCYTEYGLTRTGCAGCPFGRDFEAELDVIREHEPKLLKAVNKIFGNAYEYTRAYRLFVAERTDAEKKGGEVKV